MTKVNLSKFSSKGIINTKIFLNKQETEFFNNTLFLFPIGHSRSSSDIHKKLDQERNTQKFQKNMLKVRNLADELEKILLTKKFETSLGPILDKGWQIKRSLSSVISNPEIDEFYKKLISYGSSGGRLLGAGHSGYLMMLVDLKNQIVIVSTYLLAQKLVIYLIILLHLPTKLYKNLKTILHF